MSRARDRECGAFGPADPRPGPQLALSVGPIRIRMGVQTGRPHVGREGYVGEDAHLATRIAAAGHGGQVLVS